MKKFNLQFFTGTVYPVHSNKFYIGSAGLSSAVSDMVVIAGMENFSPSIDANVESWNPMDELGWARNAVTGKGLTISFSGKRQYGDEGNDYIAGTLLSTGDDAKSKFSWELPTGAKLEFDCVISLTTPGGGDTTNVDSLEFDIIADGKPVYTAAPTPTPPTPDPSGE